MNERPLRRGRVAAQGVAVVSPDEEFTLLNESRLSRDTSKVDGEGEGLTSGGVVTHIGSMQVRMYKPTRHGLYEPRNVPALSIRANIANGFKTACPHCGSQECEGGNTCTGREPMAIRHRKSGNSTSGSTTTTTRLSYRRRPRRTRSGTAWAIRRPRKAAPWPCVTVTKGSSTRPKQKLLVSLE